MTSREMFSRQMISRKRTNDPRGVRGRIIDTAYEAFVSQGYAATGMLEIREAAGISGGAMAHHFPAKRALGLAVIRDRVAHAVAQAWIEPLDGHADAPSAIDAIFAAIIDELTRKGAIAGCPLNNMALELSCHDPDMRGGLSAVFADWHGALCAKFQADMAAGRAMELNPRGLATLVIAAYSGAMAMAKARQDVSALIEARQELAALLALKYRAPGSRARSLAD